MHWASCRLVAFDTETTGLRPFQGDRVIEFAAVEIQVNERGEVDGVQPHQFLINPETPIPREASRVSGITDEMVADAPVFSKVASSIRSLLKDGILIAHNFGFDLGFIRSEFGRCGLYWPSTLAEIDTLPLSQRLLPNRESHRLEAVARHLRVPLNNAHRAVYDAEACGRVFVTLAREFGAPPDLDEMITWAVAVGPPPKTGHLAIGSAGGACFETGPYRGQTIESHPDYLQWMTIALERRDGVWKKRFPDALRQWGKRWLRARASGRGSATPKGSSSEDWNIDPPLWD